MIGAISSLNVKNCLSYNLNEAHEYVPFANYRRGSLRHNKLHRHSVVGVYLGGVHIIYKGLKVGAHSLTEPL